MGFSVIILINSLNEMYTCVCNKMYASLISVDLQIDVENSCIGELEQWKRVQILS